MGKKTSLEDKYNTYKKNYEQKFNTNSIKGTTFKERLGAKGIMVAPKLSFEDFVVEYAKESNKKAKEEIEFYSNPFNSGKKFVPNVMQDLITSHIDYVMTKRQALATRQAMEEYNGGIYAESARKLTIPQMMQGKMDEAWFENISEYYNQNKERIRSGEIPTVAQYFYGSP